MSHDPILASLIGIVGEDYASNRPEEGYIYGRDSGNRGPCRVDYVAVPGTVEEVRQIVLMANREKLPITPMGANLTLNGLGLPVNGGLVLDMKRMDRIIELNRMGRYVVIEAGVTHGRLGDYLDQHAPDLQHPRPEAPPMATIVGNMMCRGHSQLTLRNGNNAHLTNGMEVVLPTGEVCRIGGWSVSPWPFTKGPIPDLTGLFCGWHGSSGVVTKLSVKLFPRHPLVDVVGIRVTDVDKLPELLYKITQTDMGDILFAVGSGPPGRELPAYVTVTTSGDLPEEIAYKAAVFRRLVDDSGGEANGIRFMKKVPEPLMKRFVEYPTTVDPARVADFEKGGGFRYCGGILPLWQVPETWRRGLRIAEKHDIDFNAGVQVLGYGRSVMFGLIYALNRADEASVKKVTAAMREANDMVHELGGISFTAEPDVQRDIVRKMDPNTRQLLERIKKALDPNGIMNPGTWSA